MCTWPSERDRNSSITNVVLWNRNRYAHTDVQLGVVFKIDQSEACSTRVRNLDYDITARYTGHTRGHAQTTFNTSFFY